jgi:hypothetical protein
MAQAVADAAFLEHAPIMALASEDPKVTEDFKVYAVFTNVGKTPAISVEAYVDVPLESQITTSIPLGRWRLFEPGHRSNGSREISEQDREELLKPLQEKGRLRIQYQDPLGNRWVSYKDRGKPMTVRRRGSGQRLLGIDYQIDETSPF